MINDEVDTLVDREDVCDESTVTFDGGTLILDVYPYKRSEFIMYDGSVFTCREEKGNVDLKVSHASEERTYLLRINSQFKPRSVRIDEEALKEIKFEKAGEGWFWDGSRVLIKVVMKNGEVNIR